MPKIGIVIMHGKGGSPSKHVSDLASNLEGKGYLVANIEMPWSGNRNYDVSVSDAENEVEKCCQICEARAHRRVGLGTVGTGSDQRNRLIY